MHAHISLVQRLIGASFSPKPPSPSHLTNGVVHCPAAAQGPLQGGLFFREKKWRPKDVQ